MKASRGYKKTDVGVIPDDWELKRLREIGSFKKGKGIKKDEVNSVGLPCIRYGEIYTLHNDYIKSFTSFISREVASKSQPIRKGDLLFAGSGETAEEIGKCVAFLQDEEAYAGGDVIILSPNNAAKSEFLAFLMNSKPITKQKANLGQGNAVVHIYPKNLGQVLIPVPPTSEQIAISNALFEIDSLISSLEKLILKKQNMKQAAMQILLTGKERLKGFNADWSQGRLNEFLQIRKGEQINRSQLSDSDIYPVINGGVEPSGFTSKWNRSENTITISEGGNSCGYVNYMTKIFWSGGHCYTLHNLTGDLDDSFLFHYLKFREKAIMELRVGSGLPNIQKNRLGAFIVPIPSLKEQKEISNIFSNILAEIESLQSQLTKYKFAKQGMMQSLLTGKVRLVNPSGK